MPFMITPPHRTQTDSDQILLMIGVHERYVQHPIDYRRNDQCPRWGQHPAVGNQDAVVLQCGQHIIAQLATGSLIPSPKNDSVASAGIIQRGTSNAACVRRTPNVAGKTWRHST